MTRHARSADLSLLAQHRYSSSISAFSPRQSKRRTKLITAILTIVIVSIVGFFFSYGVLTFIHLTGAPDVARTGRPCEP